MSVNERARKESKDCCCRSKQWKTTAVPQEPSGLLDGSKARRKETIRQTRKQSREGEATGEIHRGNTETRRDKRSRRRARGKKRKRKTREYRGINGEPHETRPSMATPRFARRSSLNCAAQLGSVTIKVLLIPLTSLYIVLRLGYLTMMLVRIPFIQFSRHRRQSRKPPYQSYRHRHKAPKTPAQEDGP